MVTFVGEPASVFLAEAEQVNCLVLEDQVSSLYGGSCRSARRWVRSPPLFPCRFVFVFVHALFFNLGSSVTTIGCDFISLGSTDRQTDRDGGRDERERERERERLSRYVAVVFHSLPRSSILAEVTLFFRELGLTSTACLMLYMTS